MTEIPVHTGFVTQFEFGMRTMRISYQYQAMVARTALERGIDLFSQRLLTFLHSQFPPYIRGTESLFWLTGWSLHCPS